jgi:hypothetical protein
MMIKSFGQFYYFLLLSLELAEVEAETETETETETEVAYILILRVDFLQQVVCDTVLFVKCVTLNFGLACLNYHFCSNQS